MKITAKISALALAVLLCLSLLAGCGGDASGSGSSSAAPDSASLSASSPEDASSGASDADGEEEEPIDFSKGLDESGRIAGVTALDYVTLPEDHGAIPVPADAVAVSDEDVQAQIDNLMAQFAKPEQLTDRAIEDGDQVNIDYSGSIDGEKFDGGTASAQTVEAGSTQFIDDFLTQIIGHMPGETFNVEVTFPDPYKNNPDLAGKDAVFEVTINYIEGESITPEFNDAFVAENLTELYGWENVEAVREDARNSLYDTLLLDYVWGYVLENAVIREVPESVVEFQTAMLLNQLREQATMYGMTMEMFLQLNGITGGEEALLEQEAESLQEGARQLLVQQALAEAEAMEATDTEIGEYFKSTMDVDDYSAYEEHFGHPYLCMAVLSEKVNEHLTGGAVVEQA